MVSYDSANIYISLNFRSVTFLLYLLRMAEDVLHTGSNSPLRAEEVVWCLQILFNWQLGSPLISSTPQQCKFTKSIKWWNSTRRVVLIRLAQTPELRVADSSRCASCLSQWDISGSGDILRYFVHQLGGGVLRIQILFEWNSLILLSSLWLDFLELFNLGFPLILERLTC